MIPEADLSVRNPTSDWPKSAALPLVCHGRWINDSHRVLFQTCPYQLRCGLLSGHHILPERELVSLMIILFVHDSVTFVAGAHLYFNCLRWRKLRQHCLTVHLHKSFWSQWTVHLWLLFCIGLRDKVFLLDLIIRIWASANHRWMLRLSWH